MNSPSAGNRTEDAAKMRDALGVSDIAPDALEFIERNQLLEPVRQTIKTIKDHYGDVPIKIDIADLGDEWINLGINAVVPHPWPRERYWGFLRAWGEVVDSELMVFGEVAE